MLGLILDNIVVFLYRIIRNSVGVYRSREWLTTPGIVEESRAFADDPYPSAEVYYSYATEGATHSGTYVKGFWYGNSARSFARNFPSGRKIVVRYCPDLPARSFMREDEQRSASKAHPRSDDQEGTA